MHGARADSNAVQGVLIDLGGVVYTGNSPLTGAVDALARLRAANIPTRFLTNTTRRTRQRVIADLKDMRLDIPEDDVLTPARLARDYLERHSLSPVLLVYPGLEEEFAGLPTGLPEAVVVGDAGTHFTYERLNHCFRKLITGAPLLALAMNRNFKDGDGELSLDAGPFVAALEYGARTKAALFGKPSQELFTLAARSLDCRRDHIVMIGDDAEADVAGAIAAGMKGVLVRTGKYRAGDEEAVSPRPDHIADGLAGAVAWLLDQQHVG